jgi:uncharacterized membrane protein
MDTLIDNSKSDSLSIGERRLLVAGCCMLVLSVATVGVLWRIDHAMWLDILTMGFTEFFLGRAASSAQATQAGLHPALIVLLATYVDVLTTFILYPLLVLSYRSLFERRFFQKHMKPVFVAATRGVDRFSQFKVAGVFAFVWFPFWGTGVVVGAVLGYLLGLRLWVNMTTVTLGTMTAVICWVLAYDKLFAWLGGIHESIPLLATIVVIAILVIWRVLIGARNSRR